MKSHLCGFMLIFADQFAEVQRHESPPLRPLQMFQTFVLSMGGQVSIFPLIWFSETVPLGSCLQGWFPLTELPWIPPYPKNAQAPCQHLRHQFPSSSIGDEFHHYYYFYYYNTDSFFYGCLYSIWEDTDLKGPLIIIFFVKHLLKRA